MSALRVLSLGAGVQSSTVLLMSLAGELPRLDAAIFADTGWEPAAVYAHLGRLEQAAQAAGLPVYRVTAGNIRDDVLAGDNTRNAMPFFVEGADGRAALMRRKCTAYYKITPIRRKVRELYEQAGKPPVEQWMGISLDEVERMRSSDVGYIRIAYPLVDARMTRWDCQRWLEAHGWADVPKSACIGCPFHGDDQWRDLRSRPAEWADAVAFDKAVRTPEAQRSKTQAFMDNPVYLHRSLRPLDQVDLSTEEDHGQLNLFVNECEGLCGV